jgi:cytochrome P450
MNETIRNLFSKQAALLQLVRPPALHSVLVIGGFGIPSLLAILVVGCLVALWWYHPLYGKNQGAAIYPIVGNLIQILCHVRVFHDWNTELLKKTSNMTVRYWRPGSPAWYVTANPKNVEYMLKTNFANYPKGPETCNNLNDLLGRGIFSVDGELWKLQRKVAIHEFTTRSLRSFMQQIVQVELDTRLIPLLSHTCSAGVVVDLQDLLCRFTFDTICKLAFGVDPECLHISLPAVEFAHAFDTATKISSSRFHTYPFIWRTLRALNVGSERKLREAIHQIDEFAMSVIHKRKQQMQQQQVAETAASAISPAADDHAGRAAPVGRIDTSSPATAGIQDSHQSTAAADRLHQMDLLSRFLLLSFDESKRSSSDVVTNDSATPPESRAEAIFSDVFLRDIVISFVLAGRDTSSSGNL